MERVAYNNDFRNANVSAVIWEHGSHSYLNASGEIFKDLEKMNLFFEFAIGKSEEDKNYENVMMRSTLSSCKIQEGVRGNFIIKVAMEGFDKTADFNFTCPFHKVNY